MWKITGEWEGGRERGEYEKSKERKKKINGNTREREKTFGKKKWAARQNIIVTKELTLKKKKL